MLKQITVLIGRDIIKNTAGMQPVFLSHGSSGTSDSITRLDINKNPWSGRRLQLAVKLDSVIWLLTGIMSVHPHCHPEGMSREM